ncbi:MAG: 5-formyltetrahydrofolate cyclo-ligase [Endomicrobium sp.]|nr:5-formyltetrahydrofolate cyclo-ligase [Endomicrobium sp.]
MRVKYVTDCLELKKRKVRSEFLYMRNRLDSDLSLACSTAIFNTLKKLFLYEQASTLMIYLSYGSEVITDFIVKSAIEEGKNVVVPAITNSRSSSMQATRIIRLEDANQLVCGIRQPEVNFDNVTSKDFIDLVLIPGIVFDLSGYRLGYGKGYYDKWLKDVSLSKTVGLAYDFQIVDNLPIGKHDLPIGTIVTEQRIIQNYKVRSGERWRQLLQEF